MVMRVCGFYGVCGFDVVMGVPCGVAACVCALLYSCSVL